MPFTEFYCNASTGSNVNAGDAKTIVTSANGAWSTVTNIFTAASGTPFSGVAVGDFCALMADGGTLAVYIARVTAIGGGGSTLTLSSSAKSGTAPTTAATGITATTGGVWKGPNAAVGFPFNFVQSTMTNSSGNPPRVNLKNNATYTISAGMTHNNAGPIIFQGYTTTAGDLGKCIIDGTGIGASVVMLAVTAQRITLVDMIVANNGTSGSNGGFTTNTDRVIFNRCVAHDIRGSGFMSGSITQFFECEAYLCNGSNTANLSGFTTTGGGSFLVRCLSHDNVGSNSRGFYNTGNTIYVNCIADTNGAAGFEFVSSSAQSHFLNCDAYNNGGSGFTTSASIAGFAFYNNCNAVKNAAYGIDPSGATMTSLVQNCGFGSGTQNNTTAAINTATASAAYIETGTVTYPANMTPWQDPANGDFRVVLAAARGAGRGAFTQTALGYAGTVGYPDIGAGSHTSVGTGDGNATFFILGAQP